MTAEETKSVMFNPLGLLFGIYNAEYEQVISNDMSFNVAGEYLSWKLIDWSVTGYGGTVGVKRYFQETAPKGAWIGALAGISQVKASLTTTTVDPFTGKSSSTTSEASGTTFHVAGLVGYKWIFSGGFTTEAAAGVNVSTGTIKTNDSSTPPAGLTGVGPALSLKLGYSF